MGAQPWLQVSQR